MRSSSISPPDVDAKNDGVARILAAVRALFPGRFDNREQGRAELARVTPEPHGFLMAVVEAVHAPRFAPDAYLVRGYSDPEAPPYMARVYSFRPDFAAEAAAVRLTIHAFDGDPRFAHATLDPSALLELDPAEGVYRPGCDLSVRLRGGAVVCAVDPKSCKVCLKGVDGEEHYRLVFSRDLSHVVRRTFALDGALMVGRRDAVPYRLRRLND